jgi:hypothetical protein
MPEVHPHTLVTMPHDDVGTARDGADDQGNGARG